MANQVTEQIVRESPQIEALRRGLVEDALTLTRQPVQLPGYQTAATAPLFQRAGELSAAGVGAYQPYLEGAGETFGTAAGALGQGAGVMQRGLGSLDYFSGAQDMVAGVPGMAGASSAEAMQGFRGAGAQYDPSAVTEFQNPFMDYVEGAIRRNFAQQQNQAAAQAVGAGAFGGSREAVQRAILGRAEGETVGQAYAQDYGRAQQQAQQAFEQAQQRQLAGAQGIGSLGLQTADLTRMAGMGMGQLAGQEADISRGLGLGIGSLGSELGQLGQSQAQLGALQSNLIGSDVQRLAGMGEMEREQQQRVLDAQRQTQLEQIYQPYQDLAFRSDIFRGAPSTQMAITASTAPQPSVFQQAAGLGIAGLSAARGAEQSGLFG
jgi:hypothetical protein